MHPCQISVSYTYPSDFRAGLGRILQVGGLGLGTWYQVYRYTINTISSSSVMKRRMACTHR